MRNLILLLIVLLAAAAEGQNRWTNTPTTYYAAANATPDAVLVKGMTVIGTLANQVSYPVEVRAERLTNLQTTNTVYAVSLRTRLQQQTQVDYIDYDELDTLIRSLGYLSQAGSSITPMDNFEAVFRTRGGLSIAKVGRGTKTAITMTSADTFAVHNEMASFVLDDLARYLTAAKAKIDSIVASGQ